MVANKTKFGRIWASGIAIEKIAFFISKKKGKENIENTKIWN